MSIKVAIEKLKETLAEKVTDSFEVGTVIKWIASGRYTYVAVKTEGGWFTSAMTGNCFVDSRFDTFEEFIEVLSRSEVSDIAVATEWESIA